LKVYFDVQQLYYLPQYTPLQSLLEAAGVNCIYVFYKHAELFRQQELLIDELGLNVKWVENEAQARQLYIDDRPSWILIGNNFEGLDEVHKYSKTGLLSHGIGPKACYYTVSDSATSVRFVEGPYRTERLKGLYPNLTFLDTGYAKLDPVINGELNHLKPSSWGLDDNKKTVLYAPTFYPSSIECLPKNFAKEFSEYNVILKPHFFSLVNTKYKKQRLLLEYWAQAENVYLAGINEVNILPFMAVADVLVSDASSTLFEFSALDKPVVWCDFYRLRWAYRGLFSYRFKKRMDEDLYKYADIAVHASSYKELKGCVDSQIEKPGLLASKRAKYTMALAGKVDGKSGQRIVDYILTSSKNYE